MVVSAGLVGGQPGVATVTRHDPVETVGQVRVFAPNAKCRSYRLRWVEPDGTPGDTTAGADPPQRSRRPRRSTGDWRERPARRR
jgi:hypothetical protein